jgi:phosphinothricin acetyltransferase
MSVTLRDAIAEDMPDIVAIYNASIPARCATSDLEPITVKSRREWFERHSPGRRPLIVAERDGRVVGFFSFVNFYGRPAYHITAEVAVYVDPAHQRAGIGSTLLTEAIGRAPSLGLENLLAFVFAHNRASLTLLERFGFERRAHLDAVADLGTSRADLVILQRKVVLPGFSWVSGRG